MCAQRKNERQRKERMAEETTETRSEGSVKSIRAMLVKVRTLVRHEPKAIRIQQRFSTFVPSTQADSSKFEQGRLAADSYVDYRSLYRGKAKMHIWR